MKRIMISAMRSGSGKTVVACSLLRALQKRGLKPEGFKCGPDYIDPMFQRRAVGVPCKNLDLWLQGKEGVLRTLANQNGEVAVLEGAMGYYDGIAGTDQGSAWQIAEISETPVILVLKPSGTSLTLSAEVLGIMHFRTPCRITGLFLNECTEHQAHYLTPILERECGIPVLGYLPKIKDAEIESRHLGLITADEITDFDSKIDLLAEALEQHTDLDRLLGCCAESEKRLDSAVLNGNTNCRIAVARDAAFCFYYEENLELLRKAGAELIFFSPIADEKMPEADGLYLGGGYPELYAEQLSQNHSMLASVKYALEKGMPAIAECGGFLYLQKSLGGKPMTAFLQGEGYSTDRLQRFGYATLRAETDSLLFRKGEKVPVHEFHYWDCTENGTDLIAEKPGGRIWHCCYAAKTWYAGFPHLHFGGSLPLAERFAAAAADYKKQKAGEILKCLPS